jgi:hypothetical protein
MPGHAFSTSRFHSQAYFFADGQRVALLARQPDARLRIWLKEIVGGDPRPITEEGITWLSRPSPDGQMIAACGHAGGCSIYPVAGGTPQPLPAMTEPERPLQFSPDGRSLLIGRVPARTRSRAARASTGTTWRAARRRSFARSTRRIAGSRGRSSG